ncbi:MAG: hypothetical protein JW995_13775 [Melioribacteraceae bacterium]|nr:hypothetical protein [Melioribacteraceae bacterium]
MDHYREEEYMPYLLNHESDVIEKLNELIDQNIITRIWQKDYKVWSDKPDEISNRLGWLDSPYEMQKSIDEINTFAEELKNEGFKNALLMGMGGSSLAPEVFRLTFGVREGYLDLSVLDSTHPEAVKSISERLNPEDTLYIVSTKSGGTVETMSFMKYFYNYAQKVLKENTSKHFIAITDPGSGLEETAKKLNFRKVFINNPDIGGRFSALSLFGLVPAALVGVKIDNLLERAVKAAEQCKSESKDDIFSNPGSLLGTTMGVLAVKGIDKITFITSPQLKYFGAWLEQLIAESTGKSGKGIVPVDLEEVVEPVYYSKDRFFVYIKLKDDYSQNEKFTLLREGEHPAVQITIDDVYELGREFFVWEFATAVSGWVTGIQPFDQPNVESAKIIARQKTQEYIETGSLDITEPYIKINDVNVSGYSKGNNLSELISGFIGDHIQQGSYISLQAYLNPGKDIWDKLQSIRTKLQMKYKCPTTLGYGPRFLHSTGQLHKGDGGKGLFIQITENKNTNLGIPDAAGTDKSSISFDVLIDAQSIGDMEALKNNNRHVLKLHITKNTEDVLSSIL